MRCIGDCYRLVDVLCNYFRMAVDRSGLFVAVTSALGYRESRLYVKWEFVEASLFRISYAANCD